MQTPDLTTTSTADTLLGVFSWLVIIFAALWLLMSIIGYFHRRAYNLTLAESGGRPIKPDFLKVDKKRRKDAIERGEEYDEALEKRATATAAPPAPSPAVRRLGALSRAGAVITGSLTLVAAIVGTVGKVKLLETDLQQLSGWDSFVETVKEYPIGATVAVLVIAANILAVAQKTPAKS